MKHVLLFPGIDSIESDHLRLLANEWPEVQLRLREAQVILDKLQVPIQLKNFMYSKRNESLEWFSAMVLAAMAVQVGVFDRYKSQGKAIDLLVGMSLGDLARTVCSGASTFFSAFMGLIQFIQGVTTTTGSGSTYQVKLKNRLIEIEEYLKLEQFGVDVSVYQSDISFLISGPINNLTKWADHVNEFKDVKAQELFKIPIPLHHKLLQDVALGISPYIQKNAQFEKCEHKIFSTILEKEIENAEELKRCITENICKPVRFAQSIQKLVKNNKHVKFVNIGPSSTMLSFIKQMNLKEENFHVLNYFSEESNSLLETDA